MIRIENSFYIHKFPQTRSISSISYGTVFSGTLVGIRGIYMAIYGGIIRLDDDQLYPFGNPIHTYVGKKQNVTDYQELKATLVIENAEVE